MPIKTEWRIYDVVKEIKKGFFVLPSIQRQFVWEDERICKLMDSVMNDYPIGSFLVWKPKQELKIRTRRFVDHYNEGKILISMPDTTSDAYIVLDGQQRMQSFYIAFYGSYNGEYLYFKVDSDPSKGEEDLKYVFQFMKPDEVNDAYWMRPIDIINLRISEINSFVYSRFSNSDEEIKQRIISNLARFIEQFNMREKVVFQEVGEDKSFNDVLEIFVRVNSGGVQLTKSDLIFSTLVFNIPEMEEKLVELVDIMNGGGEFDFDIDFLVKTSFVVFDKGARYDVNKLRDEDFLQKFSTDFDKLRNAIISTMEWLKSDAKILSKRFLKTKLALIPIIDFVIRQPSQQIPDASRKSMVQYLYMAFFMRAFSRGSDGTLDGLHKIIIGKNHEFPLNEVSEYLSKRTRVEYKFVESMLKDLDLVLNIVQGGVAEIPKKRGWSLERDHIFPRDILRDLKISDELINDIGNLRLVNKTRNVLKGAKLPEPSLEFFGNDDPMLKELYFSALKNLNLESYRRFVKYRKELITKKVLSFLGFS